MKHYICMKKITFVKLYVKNLMIKLLIICLKNCKQPHSRGNSLGYLYTLFEAKTFNSEYIKSYWELLPNLVSIRINYFKITVE